MKNAKPPIPRMLQPNESLEPIPPIPEELVMPSRCLVRAALHYRDALRSFIQEHDIATPPDAITFMEGLDAIIDAWLDHPDLDIEDE